MSLSGFGGLLDDFAGSTIIALNGDPSEESLSLVRGTSGSGSFIQLSTSLVGFSDPEISFATRGTSTGFDSGVWSWSTNSSAFTIVPGNTATRSTTFGLATVSFTGISELTNASNAVFRYTASNATSDFGNNRIDNLQINGTLTAIPEPSSIIALTCLASIGAALGVNVEAL